MNPLKIKHFDYLIALAGYFIIALSVLGSILLSPGTIGFFHDWFIGPYPEMNESWANNGLYMWDSQIGDKLYGTDWIFRLTLFPLASLGGELLSKGLLILIITLSGFGAFCLSKRLKLSFYVSFAVGILYIFSPIIFSRIVAGHIYYLIAYFLSPLILSNFLKAKEENNNRYFIISGLLLSLAVIQLQFLVMVFIILLIFALVDFKRIKKSTIGLFIIFSITFLVTISPLLLPQFLVKRTEIPFNPSQLLSYHALIAASNLAESFRMLGYEAQPYSYLNLGTSNDMLVSNAGVMPPWLFYLDFLLPIIGFSVLFFKRDKYAISFSIISIIGLYLLKGLNPPFPGVFTFLFIHGFYIFREVWHLSFVYSFSITFLVAFFLERLRQLNLKPLIKVSLSVPLIKVSLSVPLIKVSLSVPLIKVSLSVPLIKVSLSVALISMIVISNGYPLLLGNFAGYLQTYNFPSEYHSLYNKLLSDKHYNVLILPYIAPIRYDSLRLQGLDPLITDTSAMIFPTILGNRASPTLSASAWLLSSMQENKTQNLGKLLSGFGIQYIVLRKDFVSNYPNYTPLGLLPSFREKWNTPLEPILDGQKDMKIISDTTQYKIYQNLNNATKIFAPITSAGGLSDFNSLLSISNITPLSNVALYPSVSDEDSLVFLDDVQESVMPLNDFLGIGKYTEKFDARDGWTDNRNSFGYDHLLASRVNEGAFTTSSDSKVSFQLPVKYNYKNVEIWMKALLWDQGGKINIQIDGKEYSVSLFSDQLSFRLFKIFEGESGMPYHITVQNIHGRNYVEGLYVQEKKSPEIDVINKTILTSIGDQKGPNLIGNSGFSLVDNQSGVPLYWTDLPTRCGIIFTCKINRTDGWDDRLSLEISTKNTNEAWSSIQGKEIDVKPEERYQLVTHMKLNNWATQSHVALEGFNETSNNWYQLIQCPSGTNGPLEWMVEICKITIPENTTKIRPVLNAGWSSQLDNEASTWFDTININKLKVENESNNLVQIKNLILPQITGNKSSSTILSTTTTIKEYNKINPTQWNLHISTSRPTTIGFAEPYDQTWEATVYKDGKKIDVVKTMPLYGVINAFQIKQTGDLDIVLIYGPQYWYQVGFVISGLTLAFCIFYIIYDWRRNKDRKSSPSLLSNEV